MISEFEESEKNELSIRMLLMSMMEIVKCVLPEEMESWRRSQIVAPRSSGLLLQLSNSSQILLFSDTLLTNAHLRSQIVAVISISLITSFSLSLSVRT